MTIIDTEKGKDIFQMGVDDMDKLLDNYELKHIHTDFFQKVVLLIIASFGFIAALAWDQALREIFIEFLGSLDSIGQKLLYAGIVTVLAALVGILMSKLLLRRKKK
jgi:hypothetical protein